MQPLLIKARSDEQPFVELAGPENTPLRLIRFGLLQLGESIRKWEFATDENEAVLDIFEGLCTINIKSPIGNVAFPEIGSRKSVFAGLPTMVYIPRVSSVTIYAESPLFEAAVVMAPARTDSHASLICPEEAQVKTVGTGNWQRQVATSLGENRKADRLIVGETVNPPGNWSSAPPHKHDRVSDSESPMEEVYHYRLDPPQGFAFQRVYTAPDDPEPFDEAYTIQNRDTLAIPRGYHPLVAGPGYRLFYLWALAGDERRYGAWTDDPQHAWVNREISRTT